MNLSLSHLSGCLALGGALLLSGLATAQDDRETTTPTGALWSTGQSIANLTARANDGWRITDLEYESTTSNTFTAALVRNTGSYAKTWWWLAGVSGAQLGSFVSANNARIIDLEPYDDNGTTRFAAVMVRNSGADAKTWWWYFDATSTQVNNLVSTNNGRLVDLERYSRGGTDRFAAVMVSNTGADARGWSYYYGVSQANIATLLNQNNQRPYSIERNSGGTYDIIGIQAAGVRHWYYFGQTASSVTNLLEQNVGRTIDIERIPNILTGTRYDVVMVDNASAFERRVWQQFAATNGAYGAWLREVRGSTLVQIRPDFVFEPASLMKTLYHVYAMNRVAQGLDSLGAMVTVPLGTTGSCPNNGGGTASESLETVLRRMMEESDNNRTLAIANRYGVSAINNRAASLGMSSTSVNHVIGCGGPIPNELTLRDLSRLHDAVAENFLLLGERETFYELMPSTLSFPTWGTATLSARINAEAATRGMPTWVRNAFRDGIRIAYKPGGYEINGVFYHSEGGFVRVPFKSSNGTITLHEYSFGTFNHGASARDASRNAVSAAALEMVWDRVRAALATWDNQVSGSVTAFGASCAGTAGSPTHTATGTPSIGSSVIYRVASAPTQSPCFMLLGLSSTNWSGGRLPLSLNFLGATGCALRVEPLATYTRTAGATGTATATLAFPTDPTLIGAALFSQFVVFDPRANPAGLTTTNGLRTSLGGYR